LRLVRVAVPPIDIAVRLNIALVGVVVAKERFPQQWNKPDHSHDAIDNAQDLSEVEL